MANNIFMRNKVQLGIIIVLLTYIGWKESDTNPEAKQQAQEAVQFGPKTAETDGEKGQDAFSPYQVCIIRVPDSIQFAGQTISLAEPDLRERLDRELHVNANWHSNTILLIKKAHRWLPQIAEILKENGIPEDFKYLPVIESSLEENARSPQDAIGFWQLLKGTAKDMNLEVNNEVDERYDPIKATEAACKYLKKSYEKFGSWPEVAASYNIGMRGFERRLEEQKVDSYFDMLLNEETARYFFRVIAIKEILENPKKYGFQIPEDQLYQSPRYEIVKIDETIPDLVEFAQKYHITYKTLKRHNPWLRDDKLKVKRNTYEIKISLDPAERFETVAQELAKTN